MNLKSVMLLSRRNVAYKTVGENILFVASTSPWCYLFISYSGDTPQFLAKHTYAMLEIELRDIHVSSQEDWKPGEDFSDQSFINSIWHRIYPC